MINPMGGKMYLKLYIFCAVKLERHQSVLLCLFGMLLTLSGSSEMAHAQATGDSIFKESACMILQKGIQGTFGAMLTVIAGMIAVTASILGAFKAAWACVFVSVGAFIFNKFVEIFFPGLDCI